MLSFEYIHKDDLAIFILQLHENVLYLCYSDECNCELLGISYPYIGYKPLYLYVEDSLYHSLLSICKKLGNVYQAYRFTCFFPHKDGKIPVLVNIISIDYENERRFLGYCSQINHSVTESKEVFANELNKAYYNTNFDKLLTLQLTSNNNLTVMDYNKSFQDYFHISNDTMTSRDLKDLVPFDIFNFFLCNCILSLSSESAISRLLNYTNTSSYPLLSGIQSMQLLITFLPVNSEQGDLIHCCIRDITHEMDTTKETRYLLEEYDALFNTSINATSILSCIDPLQPQLERMNPSMKQLYCQIPDLINLDFSKQYIWMQMLTIRATVEDTLTISSNNLTYHFKLVIVPIFRNKHLIKAIVNLINTTDQIISTTKKLIRLTPREEEIITHVIAGEKNDFIAQKLNVSVGTIKRTLSNAYNKLGISSRVELINYFHSHN